MRFISTCLECYAGEDGDIISVKRIDEDDPVCGKCGAPNYLVYTSRTVNICSSGDYNFTSHSLAMNPSQIAAHRKLFPNVEVTPDGCPQFSSVRQHSQYIDKIGMEKVTQKIRKPQNVQRIA